MKHITAGFLALWLVLGATTHVHALPIGVAIATAIGFAGTAATIVGAVITLAAGLALQFVAGALMRKRGTPDVGGTTGRMQTGGVVPRSFPFGAKAAVTHSLVYWNSFGQDGKTPNAYVAFVFALADLPIGGGRAALQELWVNGTKTTWNPAATPAANGIAISEFNKDGNDHLWIDVFDGTQVAADAFMVSRFASDPAWPYEDTRVGVGITYVRVVCRLNRDLFSGYPSFKFVCKGVSFYDPREDDTVGGDGGHRWSDQSTWENTENPITVAYNVIRGISFDGKWFFGGQTASSAQLPFSAFNAAMNECDLIVENEDDDTTEKQFRCAGEIRLDMEPADVIDDLLRACNGQMGETGGVYKPHVGPAGVAVLSITDDDIRTDEDQTFEPFFGLQDIVNSINAKYIEPAEGWTAKDAPALIDEELEAADGGRRQPVDLQYEYVPFARQVQRQNRAALLDYRRERRHALPLAPEAWRLEPAIDFVSWSSERNGYVNKLFGVTGVTDMDGYLVGVTLKEMDPSDFDDVTSVPPVIGSPTPPLVVPAQEVYGFDAEAIVIEGAGGMRKPGIRLSWDGDDQDDVVGIAYQVRLGWSGESIVESGITPPSTVPLGEHVVSANLLSATQYGARVQFVPGSGRPVEWTDWINITTPDVRIDWAAIDAAMRSALSRVTAKIDEALALANELAAAQASLDDMRARGAEVLSQEIVSTRGSTLARIEDVRAVLAGADEAMTLQINAHEARLDGNDASIETLQATKVTAAQATTLAQEVQTSRFGVEAAPGSIEAEISDIQATKVDATGAAAVAQSQMTARFGTSGAPGSIEASLTEVRAATVDATGPLAVWSLIMDVNGRISGVRNMATGSTSTIDFIADVIRFIRPSDGATVLGWDAVNEVLSIFGGTFIAGVIRDTTDANWRFEIDLTYPRLRVRDELGNVVIVIGKLD